MKVTRRVTQTHNVSPRAKAHVTVQCPVARMRTVIDAGRVTIKFHEVQPDGSPGKPFGHFSARVQGSQLRVTGAFMDEGLEGCGWGTRGYERLAAIACRRKLALVSDWSLTHQSESFWKKQEAKGRASYNEDSRRYTLVRPCVDKNDLSALRRR
jgi:hypothetical protein